MKVTTYIPNGRYWAKNVHAVREWASGPDQLRRGRRDGDVRRGVSRASRTGADWWIENDPGDAGSYGAYERRNANARKEWREVWADYLRLGGPS